MGKQFEKIFEKQAKMQGIAVRKKPLSCQWLGPGKLQAIHGELDFELIFEGACAFVDTKAFDTESITWSMLKPHQVKRAKWYMENKVNAGYVVWHRPLNGVVFYSGEMLAELEKRQSLSWAQGVYLGSYEDFVLGNLFL